jgi:hypothetical protein
MILLAACRTPRPDWPEAPSTTYDRVRITAQGGQKTLQRAVLELERTARDLQNSPLQGLWRSAALDIAIYKRLEDLRSAEAEEDDMGSLGSYRADEDLVLLSEAELSLGADAPDSPWLVLRHELGHHLHGPRPAQSFWLSEGLAHFIEQGWRPRNADAAVLIGAALRDLSKLNELELRELMATEPQSPALARRLRVRAWTLVCSLLAKDSWRPGFLRWIRREELDARDLPSLAAACGLTPEQLATELAADSRLRLQAFEADPWFQKARELGLDYLRRLSHSFEHIEARLQARLDALEGREKPQRHPLAHRDELEEKALEAARLLFEKHLHDAPVSLWPPELCAPPR